MGVQRAKPSVDHRNDRNSYTQCALQGWICETVRGTVSQRGGALQERAPPKSVSESLTFIFRRIFWVLLRKTTKTGTLFSREKEWISVSCVNGGLCPLDTHNPLKRIDLNFFDRFPEEYRAISTNPHSKILHFYPSIQILKKPLTNPSPGGIIDKLSRETRTQKARIERECSLKIVSMHNPDGKSLWSVAKSLLRSWKLPQKTFSKNFKKPLDKKETAWYNNKAVTKETAFHERKIFPIEESELIRQ